MKNLGMLALVLIGGLLTNCNFFANEPEQDYLYIPLKDYKYSKADISPETELELIAFSGGKPNDKKNIYYYQFIAINVSTGDTLRILTPLISVDESAGVDNLTYTTPLQFEADKGVRNAYFVARDSVQNLFLQAIKLINENKLDTSTIVESLLADIDANELVVVNKSLSLFENTTYKTAIGILNFKKIPW